MRTAIVAKNKCKKRNETKLTIWGLSEEVSQGQWAANFTSLLAEQNEQPLRSDEDLVDKAHDREPYDGGNVDSPHWRNDLPGRAKQRLSRDGDIDPRRLGEIRLGIPGQNDAHDHDKVEQVNARARQNLSRGERERGFRERQGGGEERQRGQGMCDAQRGARPCLQARLAVEVARAAEGCAAQGASPQRQRAVDHEGRHVVAGLWMRKELGRHLQGLG